MNPKTNTRRPRLAAAILASTLAATLTTVAGPEAEAQSSEDDRPNIILVVTDDQRWDTMDSMPWLRRTMRRTGVWFTQAYAPLPQCCPARATLLTGLYPHNHNVWKSAPSLKPGAMGGHAGVSQVESATIATWLDDAGYTTSLIGKYANGYPAYPGDDGQWQVPPGWDEWAAIFQPSSVDDAPAGDIEVGYLAPPDEDTKGYRSFSLALGGDGTIQRIDHYRADDSTLYRMRVGADEPRAIPLSGEVHSTSEYGRLARKTVIGNAEEPFFLWLNFTAPHLGAVPSDNSATREVPLVDRTVNGYAENFSTNEELVAAGKPAWVRNLPPLQSYTCGAKYSARHKCADAESSVEMEEAQRRTIVDVDKEMRALFKTLANTLDEDGRPLSESTYVIFTSDHGFMWGEHRIPHNKGVPYEESIAVPFIIFGPDVEPGRRSTVASLVDVVPTILEWAGVDRRAVEAQSHLLDGESLVALTTGTMSPEEFRKTVRNGVLIESHSRRGAYWPQVMAVPGWQAIATTRWKVTRYQRNHPTVVDDPYGIRVEGYDLVADPYELQSLYANGFEPPPGMRRAWRHLKRLTTCSGNSGETSCSIPAIAR